MYMFCQPTIQYIYTLSIANIFALNDLNLFPTGMDEDQEMKLTVSRESISRCEKAEHSQQIQRRKYKQTTASPHNNPPSLHTRSLHRLFHHHSPTLPTLTPRYFERSFPFAVVPCHDPFPSSKMMTLTAGKPERSINNNNNPHSRCIY